MLQWLAVHGCHNVQRLYWGYIGVILGYIGDNGKENGGNDKDKYR